MNYSYCEGGETQFIDFCAVANANGMTCPPSSDEVCVFASDTYAVGTSSAPSNPLFWFYSASASTSASVFRTWSDNNEESLFDNEYELTASDVGIWYITFTEASSGCDESNVDLLPQWVI